MFEASNPEETSVFPSVASTAGQDVQKEKALREFFSYPFSSDETFQHGLIGILAHQSVEEISELIVKMQLFYFNRRTGYNLEPADVGAHPAAGPGLSSTLEQAPRQADLPPPSTAATVPVVRRAESVDTGQQEGKIGSPHELTFAELKALIESDDIENIPHNKHIPDRLNECNPSQSNAPVRKKPWEVAS